ncbi:uncharacterized protein CDAR_115721 [Caerostris darwini]|uniref:Uncharacterized protein n=1 Tax=Caerostris darwini TaxID=1538125 RepID=A0AAV4PYH3_9ARAC|nr:uncharacterized protein CDAR_115721 [Caerostris darwini]
MPGDWVARRDLLEEETPDDVQAKLLSHLIPKYQRLIQPSLQKAFEILKETEEGFHEEISSPAPSTTNRIAKSIAYTVPKKRKKCIIPILEKLREINYTFHETNELQKDRILQ